MRFKAPLKRAGLPPVRFHDLRPHVRHAAAYPQREPEDSVRDAWSFDHSHNPRHLLPRAAEHAGSDRRSDGGGPFVAYCCRIAATAPGIYTRGFPLSAQKMHCLQAI
jgi:hypothetical protein